MATRKQIRANRRNSLKSTGPRTEAGRAAVRLNALKSGIDARTLIIRGESVEALQTLKDDYYNRYQPAAPEEVALVDTIINADWLLRRYRKLEAQMWEQDLQSVGTMAEAFAGDQARFNRLHRRLDAIQRDYYRAMDRLEMLQSERLRVEEEEIGFVPQPAVVVVEMPAPQLEPPTLVSSPSPDGTSA